MLRYFKDSGDGYYVVPLGDDDELPDWLSDKTEITHAEYSTANPDTLVGTPLPVSRFVGAELLRVEDGNITNFGEVIAWGFALDVGDYYLGFAHDFDNTDYSYAVFANGYRASVPSEDRSVGSMRVVITDPANGDAPIDAPEISIQLFCKG